MIKSEEGLHQKPMKEILKNWVSKTTIHGFQSLLTSNHIFLKIAWFVCIALSTTYCSYQVFQTILRYNHYDKITTYSLVNEAPTIFPAVVICNLNPYDGNMSKLAIQESLKAKNITPDPEDSAIHYIDNATNQFKSVFEYRAIQSKFNLYDNGFFLHQMLISCKFQGNGCGQNDFEYFHDYDYGNCYRFNGNRNSSGQTRSLKVSRKAGQDNGLRLELFVGHTEQQQQYIYKSGMRVVIHNQSVIPFPDDDGIDVSTGKQTNIAVSRTFINRLSSPFSDCIDKLDREVSTKNPILKQMYKTGDVYQYNQKYCLKICLQNFMINHCGCYDFSLPSINSSNHRGCFSTNDIECLEEHEIEFYNGDEIDGCYKHCPLECNTVMYSTKSTTADYPSEWYFNILMNNSKFNEVYNDEKTFQKMKQTILMIKVYYDEMFYTKIVEMPELTFEILIAFIGGNFGFFLV